ncbi:hypothetical protein ACFP90_06715 [Deinococcus multiflagellatus]|uniref:Uncharacterized protein n=1 Tax=Deinococcus multiflagellatus TaxID=1656887 RepID=A0ABW1ZGT9_9DEIO
MREALGIAAPAEGLKPFRYNPANSRLKSAETDEDVLTLARARIRHIFELFDHVSVSFSGARIRRSC